jgi:predicted RND superfamily exporter protein
MRFKSRELPMPNLRKRIELRFAKFARFIYHNPKKIIVVALLLTAVFVSQLPKITMDTSTEGFLHDDDPALMTYNAFRDQFGRDEIIIVAIQSPEIFDLEFLKRLKDFHEQLEDEVPYLDDITSLINARNTRGETDELIVEDLLGTWPEDSVALAELRDRVISNPLYRNSLISEDGRFTTILIKTNSHSSVGLEEDILAGFEDMQDPGADEEMRREYLTDEENSDVVMAVYDIIARYEAEDFRIHLAGSPVVTDVLKRSMIRDMRVFMMMVILTVGLILFAMFRRISGVVLPLLIVILSLVSTLGIMAMYGIAIKLPTSIFPSFLLAVGVGAAVHILAIFYRRLQGGDNREEAITFSLGHSGLAIVMTSMTTAAGLMSFSTAEIAPIADLGVFAGVGVLLSLMYTILLLPALLALFPIRSRGEMVEGRHATSMDRILEGIADFSTGHAGLVVSVGVVLIVIALAVALQVRFSHDPLKWIPETQPVRDATEVIDREMKGTIVVDILIDTGKENGLYDPEILNGIEELGQEMKVIQQDDLFVGKTLALTDILKEIHKALNENRDEFYVVPQDHELIAQEFLLFENSGSDDLEDFVDSQFSKTRFTMKVPWLDMVKYKKFTDDVTEQFRERLGDRVEVSLTGMLILFGRTIYAAMLSAAKSYAIAGVVITLMMILLIGNFKVGLVSMIPNLAPIILTIGIMKLVGIPMDMFTMMIGSIAIGLAVDDTIHFMHNFRRYYSETGDARESVRLTMHTAGRAMLITSIVLSTGFFIYTFASMNNLFNFGILTGLTIILALLADFLLAPALMTIVTEREKKSRQKDQNTEEN